MRKIFFFIFLLPKFLLAQNDSISFISIETSYTNKLNYSGRLVEPIQWANTTTVKYQTTKGFEYLVNQYYWSKANNKLAETDIGLYYNHDSKSIFSYDLGYEHWFISKGNGENVNTLNNNISGNLTADLNWISISGSSSFLFGNQKALLVNAEVSHEFDVDGFWKIDSMDISPTIFIDWGTSTVAFRHNAAANTNDLATVASSKKKGTKNKTVTDFSILNYDFSLPATLYLNRFEFEPAIHYSVPFNPAVNEILQNFFYFTVNVNYKLPIKHRH